MEPIEQLIPKTQQLLQPLFEKPKLQEKHLQKPPFRFLFDIIMAINDSKGGLFKNLFIPEELDVEVIPILIVKYCK